MTRIDIFSGFLGAGKTTLIKKLIKEAYSGERLVLIENEFGEIGIDGGFMKEAGIEVTEMNSGCICCSLVGDFGEALRKVIAAYHPDRILIEPSGVGKLSDVIAAVQKAAEHEAVLGCCVAVADAKKCKLYSKNFGEFYNNQLEAASCIVLSRTDELSEDKLLAAAELIRQHNQKAVLVTTPWPQLSGEQLLKAMESGVTLEGELLELLKQAEDDECGCHHHHDEDEDEHECHHHHHDEDEDEECGCHHHHDEDEDEHECHHHHHDEDEDEDEHECHHHHHDDDEDEEHECCHHHHDDEDEDEDEECGCHHHHDDEDEECGCHHHHDDEDEEHECHHHHHHGHHHADEVFTSWGKETAKKFTEDELRTILGKLDDADLCGAVLRAKGIVAAADGRWLHFDHVPGEAELRYGTPEVTGRLCVIGSKLNEAALTELFGL